MTGELVIGELGTTTDPLRLVPGSVHTLRADAGALADQAGRLEDAAADVAHRVISSWTGTAADGWAQRRGILDESLRAVGQVHRTAGTVLTAHAQVLQWAQQRAALAVDLWQVGEQKDATSALACTPTTPRLGVRTGSVNVFGQSGGLDLAPGAAWRAQAQQVLAGARLQVSASASAAARVLDAMDEGLPDGQFHFDQFLYGIGDWVAGIGELGWRFNNIRAIVDRDAWWADVRDTGTGLWDTAAYLNDNPGQTIPVLLNTQAMHDNPGRWWGNLFPDIALTLAGGAGLATKLATGARAGALAAETLTDAGSGLSRLARAKIAMYQRLIDRADTPDHLQRMFSGSQFDWMHQHNYTANQIWIDGADGVRFRLDSLNPGEAIVSRKLTDLSQVTPATARSYIDELISKYGPNNPDLVIADTPANQAQLGNLDEVIGRPLRGQPILEVPVQPDGVPQSILEYAQENHVIIRDVTGTVYSP